MPEIKLPEFLRPDAEHSKIMENLPMILLFLVLGITLIPSIPQQIKQIVLFGGVIGVLPMMFVTEWWARVAAAENIVIKARIFPWKLEKEFHCIHPIGEGGSTYNSLSKTWVTPWTLRVPVYLPRYGLISKIEVEHELPWDQRCHPSEGWVHYKGIEVKHANTVFAEFWVTSQQTKVEFQEVIPRFWLASGSEDFEIHSRRLLEGYTGVEMYA